MAIIINHDNHEELLEGFISELKKSRTWTYSNEQFIHTTEGGQWEEYYFKAVIIDGQLIFNLYPDTPDVYDSDAFGILHGRLSEQIINIFKFRDLIIC